MGSQKNRLDETVRLNEKVILSTQNIYAQNYGWENIHNFMLNIFVYLNLCLDMKYISRYYENVWWKIW